MGAREDDSPKRAGWFPSRHSSALEPPLVRLFLLTAYHGSGSSAGMLPIRQLIGFLFLFATFVVMLAASPRQNQVQSLEFKTDTQKIRVVPIVEGLDSPWSMVFLPNGDILVT